MPERSSAAGGPGAAGEERRWTIYVDPDGSGAARLGPVAGWEAVEVVEASGPQDARLTRTLETIAALGGKGTLADAIALARSALPRVDGGEDNG